MLKPSPRVHFSASRETAVEATRRIRRHREFTLEAALLQVFSVVVGILLAVAVNHAQEGVKNRQTLSEATADIRQELTANRNALADDAHDGKRLHAIVERAIAAHARTRTVPFAEFFAIWNGHRDSLYAPSAAAWDTAQAVQAPALMPYRIRLSLSQAYSAQNSLMQRHAEMGMMLESPSLMKQENLYYSLLSMDVHLEDEADDEQHLLTLYNHALAEIK